MALYLQMDGIDDKLVAPRISVDRIVLEISMDLANGTNASPYIFDNRGGTPSGNYMVYTSKSASTINKGTGITTLLVNGTTVATSLVITSNQRYTVDASFTSVLPDSNGLEFFINYVLQTTTTLKGNIYKITAYNSGTVQYLYDMTTGTVQDQSGNGNHATLTGGTWLDDGAGGTGTNGSTAFDLRQSLYSDGAVNGDTKQLLYSDSAVSFDTLQQIYQLFFFQYPQEE